MGSMTFALEQLNPKMRAQAEKKLAEMSQVRTHSIVGPGKSSAPLEIPRLASKPKKPGGRRSHQSILESALAHQMSLTKIPPPVAQYKFLAGRNFKLDFAWPDKKLAVEVQGMVHRIKERFEDDIQKRVLAQFAGWLVVEVSGQTIRDGRAIKWIEQFHGKP